MSIVNTRDKTINTKVVYYGPGLGGKTTSLKYIHSVLDPEETVRMVSLKTDEERTLFFDFLPIDLGVLGGYKVKIQGFTVPGQVKYNLTRKYVLMGADAVVFVADSSEERRAENIQSLKNLGENLAANGLNIEEIPLVFQFNKRDLADAMPIEDMEADLNAARLPAFATNGLTGEGVFDAFVRVTEAMVDGVAKKYQLESPDGDIAQITRERLRHLTSIPK
ncbi:MAG TPA: gliding-motility protein MglA [Planctomycetes bacterium]|nr:gliding-motility protein MglA [Planctomycetota bacterium]